MQSKIILSVIFILSAIPLGLLAKSLTKHETQIYKKQQYFPFFLWTIAILAAAFYTINTPVALTLTFMFLLIFTWNHSTSKK